MTIRDESSRMPSESLHNEAAVPVSPAEPGSCICQRKWRNHAFSDFRD